VSSAPRPVRLAGADERAQAVCALGVCDGSGWILGPEDVARPCDCRERRMARRRARGVRSVIPRRYRDVSLEIARNDGVNPVVLKVVGDFLEEIEPRLDKGQGLWLSGGVGAGKTALAMLVSKTAIEAGRTVAIYSLPKLLARIRATYEKDVGGDSYTQFFDRLISVDLLHLDDLGVEKRSDWVLEQLYAVVNERYETERSMVVTTNLEQPALEEQIGERTVSRLIEICGPPLTIDGDDLRYPRAPAY
jgi:DNA replication protein DnaC